MCKFFASLFLELKRFLNMWNIFLWIIIFSLGLYFGNKGIVQIKSSIQKESKFSEIQSKYFERTPSYDVYSRDGIYSLFMPSATGWLFRNTIIPDDVIAKIDSVVRLNIQNNLKGKSLNPGNLIYNMDFSGIVFYILILLGMYYGYDSIHKKEFLKSLVSISPRKRIFPSLVIPKFIVFAIAFSLLFGSQIILVTIHGIELSKTDCLGLLGYFSASILMLLFFYAAGVIIGALGLNGSKIVILMFTVWFSFVFIIPGAVISMNEDAFPDSIADYQTELNKYEVVTKFEKRAVEEHGEFDRSKIEVGRKVVEGYIKKDYKIIEEFEETLKTRIDSAISSFKNLAAYFPTTFYLMTGNEVSSKGYENFLHFYSFLQDLKRKFVRFFVDRTYYNDPKELVNFVKADEKQNLYHAHSRLPKNFWKGVIINSVWVILLLLLGNFLFKRRMFPLLKNPEETDEIKFKLFPGDKITVIALPRKANEPMVAEQIVNAFFGQAKSFKGEILVDEVDLNTKEKKNFLCLFHPDEFPEDIKTLDLLVFVKRRLKLTAEEFEGLKKSAGEQFLKKFFYRLKPMQKYGVLLAIMELDKWDAIIFFNFAFGLPEDDQFDLCSKILEMDLKKAMLIDILTKGNMWFQPRKTIRIRSEKGKYVSS